MRILNIKFKNFASYGNKMQEIEFDESGKFYLVVGDNGSGKCLHSSTKIEISIEDIDIFKKFKEFLEQKHNKD